MFKDIISMSETQYLGFGIMMPWENNLEMQFHFWQEAFSTGKIDRLKEISGCRQVVGLFCYNCNMEIQTFSYHIAGENKRNALSADFETLKLEAGNFARFENHCADAEKRFEKYNALCDEIWGQWLPASDYISLIEPETFGCAAGYASIEMFTPENPTKGVYALEMLLPVKQKSI